MKTFYFKNVVVVKDRDGNIQQIADITCCKTDNEYLSLKGLERKANKEYENKKIQEIEQKHKEQVIRQKRDLLLFALTCFYLSDLGVGELTEQEEQELTLILSGKLDYENMCDSLKEKCNSILGVA